MEDDTKLTAAQIERRERAEARAARLRSQADASAAAAMDAVRHIPLGQPILVGHHSERRHRRDLAKRDRHATKAVELWKEADRADWAAKNAGRAVMSDDPEALEALRAKQTDLMLAREAMKEINKAYKRGGWEGVAAELAGRMEPEALAKLIEDGKRTMAVCHWETKPFPPYKFTNLGANIRRIEQRIRQLEAEGAREEAEPVRGSGYVIEEDKGDGRIRIVFDSKPSREICKVMREHGFRWSPRAGAWQRQLNEAGRRAAEAAAKRIETLAEAPKPTTPTREPAAEWERARGYDINGRPIGGDHG